VHDIDGGSCPRNNDNGHDDDARMDDSAGEVVDGDDMACLADVTDDVDMATAAGIVLSGGRGVVAALANATARPPPTLSSTGTILQGILAPDRILFTVCHSGMSKLLLRDIRDVARAVSQSRRELHWHATESDDAPADESTAHEVANVNRDNLLPADVVSHSSIGLGTPYSSDPSPFAEKGSTDASNMDKYRAEDTECGGENDITPPTTSALGERGIGDFILHNQTLMPFICVTIVATWTLLAPILNNEAAEVHFASNDVTFPLRYQRHTWVGSMLHRHHRGYSDRRRRLQDVYRYLPPHPAMANQTITFSANCTR
jgi:hypothetical protein